MQSHYCIGREGNNDLKKTKKIHGEDGCYSANRQYPNKKKSEIDLPKGKVPMRSADEVPAPALLRNQGRKPPQQRSSSST